MNSKRNRKNYICDKAALALSLRFDFATEKMRFFRLFRRTRFWRKKNVYKPNRMTVAKYYNKGSDIQIAKVERKLKRELLHSCNCCAVRKFSDTVFLGCYYVVTRWGSFGCKMHRIESCFLIEWFEFNCGSEGNRNLLKNIFNFLVV